MKTSTLILALAGALTVSADCSTNCTESLAGADKAKEFKCEVNDFACICKVQDFSYAVHDCAVQSCYNDKDLAQSVADWALAKCKDAKVSITIAPIVLPETPAGASSTAITTSTAVVTVTSGSSTSESTSLTTIYSSVGGVAGGETQTAVTTSAFTTVVSTDGTVSTSVGSTTVLGYNGTPGATPPQSTLTTSTTVSSGTGAPSSGSSAATTTTSGSENTGTSSAPTDGGASSSATSSSSTGLAAQKTASPVVGFLAAAGLAAAFL